MPQKQGTSKWPVKVEEPGRMSALALLRGPEDAPSATVRAAALDLQAARIDDLFCKTLSRLQLRGRAAEQRPDSRSPSASPTSQRRQNTELRGDKVSKSPSERDKMPELRKVETQDGWVRKVLCMGPSRSERRQDVLDAMDATFDPKSPALDQDHVHTSRRASGRSGSHRSSTSLNTSRRANSRSTSKQTSMGRQPSLRSRGPRLDSPNHSDEDEPGTSRRNGMLGGSSPSSPSSRFKRSTREALREGSDQEVTAVFNRLAVDFEIENLELVQALMALGHRKPRLEWLEDILEKSFSGRSYLDKHEFAEFVEAYRIRFRDYLAERYRSSDLHIQGFITMSDLSAMLRCEGITVMPGMVRELFTELTSGGAGMGSAGFEEYLHIFDIVHERGGFTRGALVRLHATFERFDGDGDGRLSYTELRAALRWLDLEAFVDEDLKKVTGEASADERPRTFSEEAVDIVKGISEAAFLELTSRCHEREVAEVNSAFSGRDTKLTGSVSLKDAPAIFEDLGYIAVTPNVCREACAACNSQDANAASPSARGGGDCGGQLSVRRSSSGWGRARMAVNVGDKSARESDDALSLVQVMAPDSPSSASLQWRRIPKDLLFEDFYAVLEQARDTHCLSCADRAESVEAFELHCSSKAKGISLVEMANAVRWMGYPVRLGRLLEIFDEVDLTNTYRRRDLQEFLRLVARIRADEMQCARARLKKRQPFCTCDKAPTKGSKTCEYCTAEESGCGLLPVNHLGLVLADVGHYPSWAQVKRLEGSVGGSDALMPLWDVTQVLDQFRKEERGTLRDNLCFTEGEVRRFEQRFRRLEGARQGAVKRRELTAVADELVGWKRRSPRISAITREVLSKTDPLQTSEARHGSTPSSPAHGGELVRRNSLGLSPVRHASHPPSPVHEGARPRCSSDARCSSVDFKELLSIMRLIFDQDDEERLEKEREIVRDVRFSREEVREFRSLFHQASFDVEKRLTLAELEKLVTRVMPVTRGIQQEFRSLTMRVAGVGEEEALDFGSFLAVMWNLVDQNWHNINEATETLLAADAKAQRAREDGGVPR